VKQDDHTVALLDGNDEGPETGTEGHGVDGRSESKIERFVSNPAHVA
jgi:hypothetical protein